MIHTILLDAVYRGVNLTTRAVKVSSMHVNTQGFTAYHLSMYTCGVCKPVVCVNHIKLLTTSQYTCDDAEVINLVMQITGITTGKLYATQVIKSLQIVEIGIEMVAETIVILCRMAYDSTLYSVVIA